MLPTVPTDLNYCPLKKKYYIKKWSSDFISNITHDATQPSRASSPQLGGRAIKNNILEYVGNNTQNYRNDVDFSVWTTFIFDESGPLLLRGNC